MRTRRIRAHQSAFTLIEVLAAIVILGMILTVAGTMLLTTLRTKRSVEQKLSAAETSTSILKLISQDLTSSVIPASTDKDRRYFYGSDRGTHNSSYDELDFVTTREFWDNRSGVSVGYSECGYLLKPNQNTPGLYKLYRRSTPWLDESPVRGGNLTLIHPRVASLNFEYRHKEVEMGNRTWIESWKSEDVKGKRPEQVRITLIIQPYSTEEGEENEVSTERIQTVVSLAH